MTEEPLVRADPTPKTSMSRRPLVVGVVALLVLAALAGGAWWYFMARSQAPGWERVPDIAMAAPAGDAFREDTPWVTLQMAPARPDQSNNLRLALMYREGTPTAGDKANVRILGLTAWPVGGNSQPQDVPLSPEPEASQAFLASLSPNQGGWWRLSVEVEGAKSKCEFFLLLPDPNVNGPGAVTASASSPEGDAIYQRGLAGITSLKSVRYTQWLADGRGNAGISEHLVSAGGDGSPPGFIYRAPVGMEAVIIGSTRWVKLPGKLGWTEQEGAVSVPPSQWGEEYAGATQFAILGEETIDGAKTQILAFLVPEVSEPRRQSAAWYLWWVDTTTGHVRKEAMVSRVHYMLNNFSEFDAPVKLVPPDIEATPASGTPVS